MKIKKIRWVFIILLFPLLFSCHKISRLDHALKLAGENRPELEKVLEHYKNDQLKYKAAVFLIENMPGHYSYDDTAYLNSYYHALDSVVALTNQADDALKDSLLVQVKDKYSVNRLRTVSDVKIMKSDFLIDNIDRAFSVWQNGVSVAYLNFDDFCEYILPYKVCETQVLENWRLYFDGFSAETFRKLPYCKLYQNSVWKECEFVNMELKAKINPRLSTDRMRENSQIPIKRMSTLSKISVGTCEDHTELAAAVMRAKGIPVAIDFTPQWPFRSLGHTWDVFFDVSGKKIVFDGCSAPPGMPHKEDHIFAKIYRRTYSVNRDIEKINFTDRYVPDIFRDVFMKDVTSEYIATVDVDIEASTPCKSKYAYLAVFDDINWVPVCWGKMSMGKVTFKETGKDVLYLPVSMDGDALTAIADPVLVGFDGKITPVKADTLHKQTMVLNRKYPVFPAVFAVMDRVMGGQIQASNRPDFRDSVVLHTIDKYGVTSEDVFLKNTGKYRYWRYISPDGAYCNIAELRFFEKDSTNSITGKIIGSSGSFANGGNVKENVFDGDALTFFDAPEANNCWVGMDFGKPVAISRIYYLPRNDGNCIEIGDDYELVYWSGNGWLSLGNQKATGSRLVFENCPSNGLYLLHDHTKGQEERIFTYENGKQVWW